MTMLELKALALPWTTETDLPYGEQPRIYDATGALVAAVGNAEIDRQDDWERNAAAIVRAVNALSTVTPAEVSDLVDRLREGTFGSDITKTDAYLNGLMREAATALEAQAAELAAKEEARAEQWRQRREAGGSRDVARAACDTMRIERDDARAALAEARKALEPFARNVELIHPGAQDHDRLCDYGSQFNGTPTVGQARAARHALTGGQEDG